MGELHSPNVSIYAIRKDTHQNYQILLFHKMEGLLPSIPSTPNVGMITKCWHAFGKEGYFLESLNVSITKEGNLQSSPNVGMLSVRKEIY